VSARPLARPCRLPTCLCASHARDAVACSALARVVLTRSAVAWRTLAPTAIAWSVLAGSIVACGNTVLLESGGSGGAGAGNASGGAAGGGATGPHVCTAGFADCNGDSTDGCETDLGNDAAHCGSCAHDCLGSACSKGLCEPEVLASGLYFASRIALDSTRVYWTSADGTINALPLAGGAMVTLAAGQDDPWDIAVDKAGVYWTDGGADTVMSAPLGGGMPTLLTEAGNPLSIVVHGGYVYFTDTYDKASNDEHVTRVPLPSGPSQVVGSTLGAWAVAASDERAYWSDTASDTVWTAPVSGGTAMVLASGIVDPTDIEVDSDAVYVVGLEATYRIPLAGGAAEPLVWGAGRGLAIDADHVYVGTADGRVLRAPKAGGAALALARTELYPYDMAVNDQYLYWVVRAQDGLLVRTPK
jgi:hypothetical protein